MRLTIYLHPAVAIALRRFVDEVKASPPCAAAGILIEYLTQVGLLEMPPELDKETETKGSAWRRKNRRSASCRTF